MAATTAAQNRKPSPLRADTSDSFDVGQLEVIERKLDTLTQHVLNCLAPRERQVSVGSGSAALSDPDSQVQKYNLLGQFCAPSCSKDHHVEHVARIAVGDAGYVSEVESRVEVKDSRLKKARPPGEGGPPKAKLMRKATCDSLGSSGTNSDSSARLGQDLFDLSNAKRRPSLAGDEMASAAAASALGKTARQRGASLEWIWNFLEVPQSSRAARLYHHFFRLFLGVTVVITFCQAFESGLLPERQALIIESAIDVIFLVEVWVRFFSCPSLATLASNPHTVIDVMTAVPLVLRVAVSHVDLPDSPGKRQVQAVFLGIVPVLRLLRSLRHSTKFHLLSKAFMLAFEALPVLLYFYFLLWLFFSSLIYAMETSDNIPKLTNAMWLTLMSMTTVGFGDVIPKSGLGRVTVGVLVIASQMYMAIPLGILGSCFSQVWHERDKHLLGFRVRGALRLNGYAFCDLPDLFDSFDSDSVGELSFHDFRYMVEKLRLGLEDERLLELFENIDDDGSGRVAVEEFIKFLSPSTHWEMYGEEHTNNRLRSVSDPTLTRESSKAMSDGPTATSTV